MWLVVAEVEARARLTGLGGITGMVALFRPSGCEPLLSGAVSSHIRVETLENGLSVILREVRVAPVAEVQVWARVGSADETADEAGLAHFHEHMLFKGTERRGVGEIAGTVEGSGGRINAFTSYDATCYHATLPSDVFGLGLDVLADAAQYSSFEPAEVAREIDVVLEEIQRAEDDPQHVLSDALFATVFRTHAYRAPVLGTRASVASFTQQKLLAFYRRWYAPDNLVLVATGDFDGDAFLASAAEAFAAARPAAPRRARASEPPQREPRVVLAARPFERASFELAWPAVALTHADAPLLDLLAFVLGEGESSRLVRRVKEDLGLVDRIDASCYTPLDPGLFAVGFDLEGDQAAEAIATVAREVERLRHERVAEDEIEKARRNFLASRAWERESVSGMARKLGSGFVLAGDPLFEESYLDRVRHATRDELLRVAHQWLAPERLSLVGVIPQNAAPELSANRLLDAAVSGARAAERSFLAPARRGVAHGIHEYALESGAQLYVLPRREIPVVAARAVFLGGQLAETEETAGLSSFLTSMWLRGTRSRSASDFATRIESLAADIDSFCGRNSVGLTFDCTSDQLAPVVDLFAEALLEPGFAEEEIERERRDTLAALARREDQIGARTFELFAQAHYQQHPYRLPIAGTPETVKRFELAQLLAHQERLIGARNLVVAVVGDVDPDEVASLLSPRIAALAPGAPFEANLPAQEPAPRELRSAFESKDRAQAHLVLGFRGLTLADPDREALEVLSQLLAGQSGRLFLELRDRRGLAYSVSAANVEGLAPGYLALYIATSPQKYDEALAGMRDELRRMTQDAPPEGELARARRCLIGNHAIDQQRGGSRALQLALDVRYGLGADASRRYPERVGAVSSADVLRVAQRVIDLSAYTLAAIRP